MMFAASAVTDSSLQVSMINQVKTYVGASVQEASNFPFTILYSSSAGNEIAGYARYVPMSYALIWC